MIPTTDAIMRGLEPAKHAVGIAVGTATRSVASILGVALIGSVVAMSYRMQMGTPELVPAGLRRKATESIGSSTDTASLLPPRAAERLLHDADAAFSLAFHVATAITLAAFVITAVVAWKLLPSRELAERIDLDVIEEGT